jgi:hypothetical protein
MGEHAGTHRGLAGITLHLQDRGYIQQHLQEHGVNCVVRVLQVGDFMWVARRRRSMDEALLGPGDDGGERELVLGYIGERKRMDDLSSSIIDGRFREQHVCAGQNCVSALGKASRPPV